MDDRPHDPLVPFIRDIQEVRQNWGTFLALGILLIVLGTLAIVFNIFTTFFSILFLGGLLVVSGAAQIAQSFLARKWSGLFTSLIAGILYIIIGFFCLAKPMLTATSLTLLISAILLVGGLVRMITAGLLRFEHWGWVFFNGFVTFILGMLIYSDWPVSGLWIIGMFIGIDMLLSGWSWVILALSARPKEHFKG
ncbi:MAG: HdeD family acid-resistance protein [Parachlamydia sp.]|nr:HdeD family acid-resistance protein [Parachlamydia sp.]